MRYDAMICLPGVRAASPAANVLEVSAATQPADVQPWLDRYVRNARRRVVLMKPAASPIPAWLDRQLAQHFDGVRLDTQTSKVRAPEWGRNFVATLRRKPRWVSTANQRWRGMPAFIVGAGAALDRNGHLLRDAAKRGPIVTVNSAAGCCARWKVEPDVVCCSEIWDMSTHLRPWGGRPRTLIALDAYAAPANWDASGDNVAAYLRHEPYVASYGRQLGVATTHYSSNSSTAAAALALAWGASPIVMVGQQNSVIGAMPHEHHEACEPGCQGSHEGARVYGEGSPFHSLYADMVGRHLCFDSPDGCKDEYASPATMRPAWGGGEVPSDAQFTDVIEWWGEVARAFAVVNATEAGARVQHAQELTLREALERFPVLPPREPVRMEAPDTDAVLSGLRERASDVIDRQLTAPPWGFDLLHMWTATAAIGCRPSERLRVVAEATQRGAREVMEACDG